MLVAAHRLRRQIGVNFPRYGSETVENLRREQAANEQIAAAVEAGRPMAVDNGAIAGALFGAQTVEQAVVEDRREDLEPARVARAGKAAAGRPRRHRRGRSEEHTSELPSLMRISYAVFCLNKKNTNTHII